MGKYSLLDLALAGIKWELDEPASPESLELRAKSLDKGSNDSQISTFNSKLSTKSPGDFVVAPIPVTPTNAALDAADAAASACADFESLCAAIKNYNHPLSSFANFVPPQFSTTSHQHQPPITIITDLPSSDDDAAGKIMTGAAGELLDKMLSSIGIKRNMVTIIPLLFWRTPGGRTPSREELDLCRPFVNRAIELVDAKKILTLGTLAATEIASAKLPTDHGKVFESRISNFEFRTIPIWHPNYMLLKPDSKRDVWDALQNLQKLLQNA